MKVAVHGYRAGKAWLCICVGVLVEPPFSKSWIRHCRVHQDIFVKEVSLPIIASLWLNKQSFVLTTNHTHFCTEDIFEPEM